jgi:pSer/pThr/pTyr-binding forkhead associated (FHA) protein
VGQAYLEVEVGSRVNVVGLHAEAVSVGRSPDNSLALSDDDAVSRRHAVFERSALGWSVRDTGSSNGTFVNGDRLHAAHSLSPGDRVVVGGTTITFRASEASQAASAAGPAADSAPPVGYLDTGEEWAPAASASTPATAAAAPVPVPRISPEPVRETYSDPPPQRGRGSVRGIARGVQTRRESDTERDILAFRVDRYDSSGNRLQAVAVELRDHRHGHINEGEEVEVRGTFRRGTLIADNIVNLSTNAEVRGSGMGRTVALGIAYVFVLGFIATIFSILIYSFIFK